jgi:hypothetical protein
MEVNTLPGLRLTPVLSALHLKTKLFDEVKDFYYNNLSDMKKQILFLAAALISVLMACNSENRSSGSDSTSSDTSMSSMSGTDPMQDSTSRDTTSTDTTTQNGNQQPTQ